MVALKPSNYQLFSLLFCIGLIHMLEYYLIMSSKLFWWIVYYYLIRIRKYFTKQLYWDGWADFLIPKFVVREKTAAAWFLSLWGGWWGHALPTFIVTRHDTDDDLRQQRTLVHECRHIWQLFVFWIFQPIIYACHTIYLYIFTKRHAYYDNCFERDARRHAGQIVDIPKEMWKDSNDRWPWWWEEAL